MNIDIFTDILKNTHADILYDKRCVKDGLTKKIRKLVTKWRGYCISST